MLKVTSDLKLRNCPLCGSDRLAMMAINCGTVCGSIYASAEIECFACGTRFLLRDKTIDDIVNLWNGKEKQK